MSIGRRLFCRQFGQQLDPAGKRRWSAGPSFSMAANFGTGGRPFYKSNSYFLCSDQAKQRQQSRSIHAARLGNCAVGWSTG
jgi:hypothetical protein